MKNLHIFYGVSGSGKTHAANCIYNSIHTPVIRFDNIYNYDDSALDFDKIKAWTKSDKQSGCIDYILDGFLLKPEWISKLREIFDGTIVLEYVFNDIDFLHASHKQKQAQPAHGWYRKELLYPDPIKDYQVSLIDTNLFYQAYLSTKDLFNSVVYTHRDAKGLHESTEIALKNSVHKTVLRFIDLVSASPEYQDVEYFGERIRKSDSLSTLTWDTIKNLTKASTFTDKTVADLGPFNGFFSIKAHRAGAKLVHGYEENKSAVRVATIMTHINHCWTCETYQAIVGSHNFLKQDYDIIMALNMLHHVKNRGGKKEYQSAVSDLFTHAKELVIVEINDSEIKYMNSIAEAKGFKIAGSKYLHKLTAYGWRHVYCWRRVK